MPNFRIAHSDFSYAKLPRLILEAVVGFKGSPEYQELVDDGCDDLPGVVLSAVRRAILRSLPEPTRSPLVETGFDFIENLARSSDDRLNTALVEEILELLDPADEASRMFISRLQPASRRLYDGLDGGE